MQKWIFWIVVLASKQLWLIASSYCFKTLKDLAERFKLSPYGVKISWEAVCPLLGTSFVHAANANIKAAFC